MSPKEAIAAVLSRLRARERHRLLIFLFGAFALGALALRVILPASPAAAWTLGFVAALGALSLLFKFEPLLKPTELDAASYLDAALKLKDRAASFVGLVSTENQPPNGAAALIEKQLSEKIGGADVAKLVYLPLTKIEKASISVGFAVLAVVLALMLLFPRASGSGEAAALINELISQEPDLPPSVAQSLEDLKKTLQQNEPSADEVKKAIQKAKNEIAEARSAKERSAGEKDISPEANGEKHDKQDRERAAVSTASPTPTPDEAKKNESEKSRESKADTGESKDSSSKGEESKQGASGQGSKEKESGAGGKEPSDNKDRVGRGPGKDESQKQEGKSSSGDDKSVKQDQAGSGSKTDSKQKDDKQNGQGGQDQQKNQDKNDRGGRQEQKSGSKGQEKNKNDALDQAEKTLNKIENGLQQKQSQNGQGENQKQAGEKESKSQASGSGKEGNKENKEQDATPKGSDDGSKAEGAEDKKAERGGRNSKDSSEQGESQKADKSSMPNTSESGQKTNPFSDSVKAGIDGPKEFKESEIQNPDEKYDTRFAEQNGTRELNPNEAKPQIDLGRGALAKPDISKDASEQEIPPEYRDLMD